MTVSLRNLPFFERRFAAATRQVLSLWWRVALARGGLVEDRVDPFAL